MKHTPNGAATKTADAPTSNSLDDVARFYQGKRQRDFGSPIKVTLKGKYLRMARQLKAELQKGFGLKAWQAESVIIHCALVDGIAHARRNAYIVAAAVR